VTSEEQVKIELHRINDRVHFQAVNPDGNTIEIDGAKRVGGEGAGFRPMQLALAAVASCSVMDLVPIL
jgi:putative redox protein